MSPEDCHVRRNEFLALARKAEKSDKVYLGGWYRIFAQNLELMAHADPDVKARGAAMLKKNAERFERDMKSAGEVLPQL